MVGVLRGQCVCRVVFCTAETSPWRDTRGGVEEDEREVKGEDVSCAIVLNCYVLGASAYRNESKRSEEEYEEKKTA